MKSKNYKNKMPKILPIFLQKYLCAKWMVYALPVLYFIIMAFVAFNFHNFGDYGAETDFFCSYVPQAKEVMKFNIYIDEFKGPVYPMVLSIFSVAMQKRYFQAGILISLISASLVLFFTHKILRKIFSVDIACIAIFLLMLNPIFLQYSYTAGTDMFFNALLSIILYLFFKEQKLKWKNFILIGILTGIAYLTRYNAIFLLPAIPLGILFTNFLSLNWKNRFWASGLFLLTFLFTITPWGIYCFLQKGSFFYNHNIYNVAYEIYYRDITSWDDFWFNVAPQFSSIIDVIFKDFGVFVKIVTINIYKHLSLDINSFLNWKFNIFVFLPLLLFFFCKLTRRKLAYFLINLCFFGLLLPVFYMPRFALFLIPFYILIAVHSLKIFNYLPWRISKIITILIIVFLIFINAKNSYHYNKKEIQGAKEAARVVEWFKENVSEEEKGASIAARVPHMAYFLNLEDKGMPYFENYEKFIADLKNRKVDYLFLSNREMKTRKNLKYLTKLIAPNVSTNELQQKIFIREKYSAVLYEVQY